MSQLFIYPVLFTIVVVWWTVSKWMYISKIFKDIRIEMIAIIFLTILFGVLNQDLLFNDTYRVVADNWKYDYPYFHYFLIHISQFDELPLWNFYVNAGEPLFLYLNHNYLLHISTHHYIQCNYLIEWYGEILCHLHQQRSNSTPNLEHKCSRIEEK